MDKPIISLNREFSKLERTFRENNYFSFTGKDKIESIEDVAFIFRNLQDFSIENLFFAFVKNKKATILHNSMGGYAKTLFSITPVIAMVNRLEPDEIYMVHNHPSGQIIASQQDKQLYDRLKNVFGDKVKEGIIINLTSGLFGTFDSYITEVKEMPENLDKTIPIKVLSFDKLVFEKDFDPSQNYQIDYPYDVAQLVSGHRLGKRSKLSIICTDNANRIVGNFFTPYTLIENNNIDKIAYDAVSIATNAGGTRVTLYGSIGANNNLLTRLERDIASISNGEISLADFIQVTPRNSLSWNYGDEINSVTDIENSYHCITYLNKIDMKKNYEFDESQIDWAEMESRFGITKEKLVEAGVLEDLLKKNMSSALVDVIYESREGIKTYPSRIKLYEKEGEIKLSFYSKRENVDWDSAYQGYTFDEKEQKRLENGEGVVISIKDFKTQEDKRVLVTLDELTNRFFHLDINKFRLPNTPFFGVNLQENDANTMALLNGDKKKLKMISNGNAFERPVRINACTRKIEIVWEKQKNKINIDTDTHYNNVKITKEMRKAWKKGEEVKLPNQKTPNSKGEFTSYVSYNPEKQTMQHRFPEPKKTNALKP